MASVLLAVLDAYGRRKVAGQADEIETSENTPAFRNIVFFLQTRRAPTLFANRGR